MIDRRFEIEARGELGCEERAQRVGPQHPRGQPDDDNRRRHTDRDDPEHDAAGEAEPGHLFVACHGPRVSFSVLARGPGERRNENDTRGLGR